MQHLTSHVRNRLLTIFWITRWHAWIQLLKDLKGIQTWNNAKIWQSHCTKNTRPEKSATNKVCPWRPSVWAQNLLKCENLLCGRNLNLHRAKRNLLLWTAKSCTCFSTSAFEYNKRQGEKSQQYFYVISVFLFPITENCLSIKGMKIMGGGKKCFWKNSSYKAQRTTTCSHNTELKTISIYNSNSCSFQ